VIRRPRPEPSPSLAHQRRYGRGQEARHDRDGAERDNADRGPTRQTAPLEPPDHWIKADGQEHRDPDQRQDSPGTDQQADTRVGHGDSGCPEQSDHER
jgi:hypothetical protein